MMHCYRLHQTHYEQMGYIRGIAVIDGKEHSLDMPCLRDRSFGNFITILFLFVEKYILNLKFIHRIVVVYIISLLILGPLREWRNFHRYVYHFMFLENGDCMAVGSVSEPTVLSQ